VTTTIRAGLPFLVFTAAIVAVVFVALRVSARRRSVMTFRRAAISSALWIGIALGFGIWVAQARGREGALAYFAAYLTEESLSLDNMVVFMAIFARFGVPLEYRERVLSWGVLGAILMRAGAIFAGAALLERLAWIRYLFGALLIIASIRLLRSQGMSASPGGGVTRLVGRVLPVTTEFRGAAFFCRLDGQLAVTPLFLTLVSVEVSDIVFATDSIPAVFAVTRDPFLVYTSNILAVLGLRSLYFLVAGVIPRLRYIRYGLIAILAFVGAKMLLGDLVDISIGTSLLVIAVAITGSVVASLWPRRYSVRNDGS
jgi:tellurite resistance protein TerC